MRKIIKAEKFVFAYSYSKRNGLLTKRMYSSNEPQVVFIRTVYVRPGEVDRAFKLATEINCICDVYYWLKDGHFSRRSLKNNPYFKKSGEPKQKWYKL